LSCANPLPMHTWRTKPNGSRSLPSARGMSKRARSAGRP
jgi:hypothetical protein